MNYRTPRQVGHLHTEHLQNQKTHLDSAPKTPTPKRLFVSYAHRDMNFVQQLETHLQARFSTLNQECPVTLWYDQNIVPGNDWEKDIQYALNTADIILLILSADFIASDYCHDQELPRAIERHQAHEAIVIPILLKPCLWQALEISCLPGLPKNRQPITSCGDPKQAFNDIIDTLETVLRSMP